MQLFLEERDMFLRDSVPVRACSSGVADEGSAAGFEGERRVVAVFKIDGLVVMIYDIDLFHLKD